MYKTGRVDLTNLQYGDKFTCELGDGENKTFYVLENNTDTVSLIMNMNVDTEGKGTTSGNTVAWSSNGSNANGPVTALEYLKNSTESWDKLKENQINLPTGQQIATAGGDTAWTDRNYTGNVLSSWLYENLNSSSAPYGYWTSNPHASGSSHAWRVGYDGNLSNGNVDLGSRYGVRPVITISKSQLS